MSRRPVTFSAEPDVSPDDGPLPDPGPIDTSGIGLVGIQNVAESEKAPPTAEELAANADKLLEELEAARAADPNALLPVSWVQFIVNARLSGRSAAVAAISATKQNRLLLDRQLKVIVIEQHGTFIPLSNVAAFGLLK